MGKTPYEPSEHLLHTIMTIGGIVMTVVTETKSDGDVAATTAAKIKSNSSQLDSHKTTVVGRTSDATTATAVEMTAVVTHEAATITTTG